MSICRNVSDVSTVFIIGHKRPDTDSIAAAISYAYLKSKVDPNFCFVPARLGELNPETSYVLSYFGVNPPKLIEHVYIQVEDAMTKEVVTATESSTIYEAGNIMLEYGIRTLPIVDERGKLVGLVTERKIARSFLKEFRGFTLEDFPPKVKDVLRIMEGELLSGDPNRELRGRPMIGAMSARGVEKHLRAGDVLITGDREDVQRIGIEKNVSCLIVTGGVMPTGAVIKMAKAKHIPIILTNHNTYVAGRLLRLSSPVLMITNRSPLTTFPETLLREFEDDLMEDKDGVAVVIDSSSVVRGIITRHDLINPRKKKVILVDHSEVPLSVEGIEEAEILEIVDHHRLGGLETGHPLTVYIKPVGSTCTIIWELFQSYGVEIPKHIAGVMLSAILSDTLILRSPTTTLVDERAVSHLKEIAGVDPVAFGIEMFKAKMDPKHMSIENIITMDMKELHTPRGSVAVSQIEAIEPEVILERKDEILKVMENIATKKGYTLFVFMITDVMKGSSMLLITGQRRIAEKAFGRKVENGVIWLEGVVSRKKQVLPRLYEVM